VRVEEAIEIARPVEDVFAFASDFANDTRWSGAIKVSEQTSDGPLGLGTTVHQVGELMGQRVETSGSIVTFEPGSLICYRSDTPPVPHQECRAFEATANGTRVVVVLEARLSGMYRLAEGMIRGATEKQMRADLAALRSLLESSDGVSA
jgi:uncharacterized membrane protein